MSAHHAFGARTWPAPAIIGAALVVLALVVGGSLAGILRAFPVPILAALLLVAGVAHVRLLSDLRRARLWGLALGVGLAGGLGHLLAGVVAGLVVAALWRAHPATANDPGTSQHPEGSCAPEVAAS